LLPYRSSAAARLCKLSEHCAGGLPSYRWPLHRNAATLFVIWQIISYLAFKAVPATPVLFGGALIAGGLIITFWRPTA
jgi:hypothetical protein